MILQRRTAKRDGTTMIETALVLPIFILLVFGVFEYGRFSFVRYVMDNAAREGARYAVVNTANKTTAEIQAYVTNRMATQAKQFTAAPTISVYYADATGEPDNTKVWTDAAFGQAIGVRITGNYKVLLGAVVRLPSTISMTATSLMKSEAN